MREWERKKECVRGERESVCERKREYVRGKRECVRGERVQVRVCVRGENEEE